MSRTASRQNLHGFADSDSDDDLNAAFGTERAAVPRKTAGGAMPVATRGRGRPAANKVTKPARESTRRTSGRLAAAVGLAAERQALADKPRNQKAAPAKKGRKPAAKPVQEEDDQDDASGALVSPPSSDPPKAKRTRGRPKAVSAAQTKNTAAEAVKSAARRTEVPAPAKRGRKPAPNKAVPQRPPPKSPEIPETQEATEPMDIEVEDGTAMEEVSYTSIQEPSIDARPVASSPSKHRRSPIAGDFDESDSSLRRRLGEMNKRYDSLEAKYRDLREIGIKEAERSFDRLKKQSDERTKSANDLISKLKAELGTLKEMAKEGQRLQRQLDSKQAEAESLESQTINLQNALDEAKKEARTLSTKLAASRAAEIPVSVKAPGSALKAGSGASRSLANVEVTQLAQAAQMKEDLYGDLTGLIIRGVKRDGEEDVFDCIQTGRNGTLHFKLSIPNELSGESFDEAEFTYMPQIDPRRDAALVEVLPDYLVEEINFARPQAAKFYARVMKSLTEKPDY